jgi:D-glycero-D-manno-heptose 1,7-bisphosphate phosphatase
MPRPSIRNLLLDRDGTIIKERHYLHDPAGVSLIPGTGPALARLGAAGKHLFIVTNQSGIGRGYYAMADFEAVQCRLLELLAGHDVRIADTVCCPHTPDTGCSCRKPAIGLFTALRERHGLLAAATAVMGDAASDIAFGLALGSPLTILVLTGHGMKTAVSLGLPPLSGPVMELAGRLPNWPHVLARDLPAAADWLLGAAGQ